ncbi:MAG: hypothetical protein F6J93_40015 [Oscillatoria sp. SIO1A7]|nr:hypothetical protein [Oscillatoria sp. SIO1A7]
MYDVIKNKSMLKNLLGCYKAENLLRTVIVAYGEHYKDLQKELPPHLLKYCPPPSNEIYGFACWLILWSGLLQDLKADSDYSGSRFRQVESVQLGCISREANLLLDKARDGYQQHWEKNFFEDSHPNDIHGFSYWLIRWSDLVQPTPTNWKFRLMVVCRRLAWRLFDGGHLNAAERIKVELGI